MERPIDDELNELRRNLLEMARRAEEAIASSIGALAERRADLARTVFDGEAAINALDVKVDESCLRLLALRQPVAADLRRIVSAMKIASDLERIGDLAVNIAERTIDLIELPPLKPLLDLPLMARLAARMVHDALDAFVRGDDGLAREVCGRDDEIDKLNQQVFRELLTYMMSDPSTIGRAVDLILIGRSLERIADHATNIGEDVIYMRQGKIIKHHCDEGGGNGPRAA